MDIKEFEKEVKKLYFEVSGLDFESTSPKWWKIKTSVKSIIENLYKLKRNKKFLEYTFDSSTNRYHVNGDIQGINESTFRQYFIIGYILGVFEIDIDIAITKSFKEYALSKNKFILSSDFCSNTRYESFLIRNDLYKVIKNILTFITPKSFIWEPAVNLVFTLCTYAITEKYKAIELMAIFLESYKQKENTKILGANEEFIAQKEIAIKIKEKIKERKL